MDRRRQRWKTTPPWWERLKPLARAKRQMPTPAEKRLWQRIRQRQLHGIKFRRQQAIGQFIVDFYAPEIGLVIEVDGPAHEATAEQDTIRQAFLESVGLRVLRFTNDEVLGDIEEVLKRIASVVT